MGFLSYLQDAVNKSLAGDESAAASTGAGASHSSRLFQAPPDETQKDPIQALSELFKDPPELDRVTDSAQYHELEALFDKVSHLLETSTSALPELEIWQRLAGQISPLLMMRPGQQLA